MPPVVHHLSAPFVDRFQSEGLARALLLRLYVLHSLEDIRSSTYQPSLPTYQRAWRSYILQFRPGIYAGPDSTPPLSPRSVFERERASLLSSTLIQLTGVDQYLSSAWMDYTAWRVASALRGRTRDVIFIVLLYPSLFVYTCPALCAALVNVPP